MSEVTAYVTVENGRTVLHDPILEGVIAVVDEHNHKIAYEDCKTMFDLNAEAVERFKKRFAEKGYEPEKHCIVLIQVDDPYGGQISDVLMPNENWQVIRDQGLEPIARGIADRRFMTDVVAEFDAKAAEDLDLVKDCLIVIVVASSVARVFVV